MVREKGLEDYIVNELINRGWRFVESSKLPRDEPNKPLLTSILRIKIKEFNPNVSEKDVTEAILLLETRSTEPKGAREILEYLKFGVPVKLSKTRTSARLKLINYNNPSGNDFIVSTQVIHIGVREIRNDIVLYVNGIPLVNIEVKNPTDPSVSWKDAFHQIKRYEEAVPELYKYVQIGVAVEAVAKYFPIVPWAKPESIPVYEWKEENLDSLDSTIDMLRPEKLLDILKYFLYFRMEEGRETKVIARYMQYRAANKIVDRVFGRLEGRDAKDRGLIWHWQGSGKTLIMIFAAMKLYWKLENPSIFFVIDRVDLQDQLYFENLTKLDLGPEVKPKLVDSIERLREVLSFGDYRGEPGLFVVTVQKFQPSEFEELEKLLKAVADSRPETIVNREDVVVFVDEAHRTQYGVLAEQMMSLLKRANYFAFTGTPVPRKNPLKNTFAKFSPPDELYLDKYFILDSISDGYTVKIAYQPGPFDYKLDRKLLEEFFESEFDELPDEMRTGIEKRIGKELDIKKFKVFLENEVRIDRVARYIAGHFKEKIDGRFKAMVVAASRKACVLYKEALDRYLPPEYSEVVMTFQRQEKDEKVEEYRKKLLQRYRFTDPKDAIKKIIDLFKTEDNPKILIVTDMLLTGFDEPRLQTMYFDKPLKGHRLLQAIARINRPYRNFKECGLVIDFVGVFDELAKAFAMYEEEDLKGAVFDVNTVISNFKQTLDELLKLIGPRPKAVAGENDVEYKQTRKKAMLLIKDKELERKFIDKYKVLRRLYELIYTELEKEDISNYKWLSEIYTFYVKNFTGESSEERQAENYYARTLHAISQSLEVIERQAEFVPLNVDSEFFEKFIQDQTIEKDEKVATLMMGLLRFKLYARSEPAYIYVVDKIEELLKKWRSKIKTSLELYEDAVQLWREIFYLNEEFNKLGLTPLEFTIYRTLVEAGFSETIAKSLTREVVEKIEPKVNVPGWTRNPKLFKDVEKDLAITILKGAKSTKMREEKRKDLITRLIERVKNLESKQE
ncbi:MAG: HsdR family type I site-specific deoxyribonuclease [Thermofilum sp.]|uniref:type I restriction endonuclease subunit R n=1 Tax=Thermofilum sp. TaxID=1961369 RepID=UPI00316333F2